MNDKFFSKDIPSTSSNEIEFILPESTQNQISPYNNSEIVDFIEYENNSIDALNTLKTLTSPITEASKIIERKLKDNFRRDFLHIINESNFEFGFITPADNYLISTIEMFSVFAWAWINEMFIEYFSNPEIISSLLRILAHLPESAPSKTMALACTNYKNSFVQECAIRCFENWENTDSIELLKSLDIQEEWLNSYRNNVLSDLEKNR